MKILRGIFLFMYSIDKGIYREKIQPNRYFATLSVLVVLLIGMMYNLDMQNLQSGAAWYINYDYKAHTEAIISANVTLSLVWVVNVGEGIMAAQRWWISPVRGLMLAGVLFMFYVLGEVLPPVAVAVVVGLWLVGIVIVEIVAASTRQPARICPYCGQAVAPGHAFCGECGQRV